MIKQWNTNKEYRDDGYTIGDLLDYLYYQKYYKHVGIDLSRQKYDYSSTN